MRKVIDLECNLPPDENNNPRKLEAATHPLGYGDAKRLSPLQGHAFRTTRASLCGVRTVPEHAEDP
jgi:hypothetical protein